VEQAAEISQCLGDEEAIASEVPSGVLLRVPLTSSSAAESVISCTQEHPQKASHDLFISLTGAGEASCRVGSYVRRVMEAVRCPVLFSFTTLTYANRPPPATHPHAPIQYSLCLRGLAEDDLREWHAAFGRQRVLPDDEYDLCFDVGDQRACDHAKELWQSGHVSSEVLLRVEVETVRDSDVVMVAPHVVDLHRIVDGELEFSYRLVRT
jgi:hypothetical protein